METKRIIVKNVRPETIRTIAYIYVNERSSTFYSIGSRFDIHEKKVSSLLFRGIAEGIIDGVTCEKIYSKVVSSYPKGKSVRQTRWIEAFDKRSDLISSIRDEKRDVSQEIGLLEFQISSFDNNYFSENATISKQDLEDDLYRAYKTLEKLDKRLKFLT